MADMEKGRETSLVRVRRDLVTRETSLLARRALDDLARLIIEPATGAECAPFHVLYASGETGFDELFHHLVTAAVGTKRHIFPVWTCREQEIRLVWTQQSFHCAFLVLNNLRETTPDFSSRPVLALIRWMRDRGSATIIAFSGNGFEEEEALRGGADRFFHLPFPPREVLSLLTERFGTPTSSVP